AALEQLVAPGVIERLGDLVIAADLLDRSIAAQPRQHDLDLLLGGERPVLALLAHRASPLGKRPMLEGAPDAISASAYGLGSDRVRETLGQLPVNASVGSGPPESPRLPAELHRGAGR